MGITETEIFCDDVNRVTSVSSLQMKNRETELPKLLNATSENGSIRSKIRKMGPICKTRRKVAVVFPESSVEDDGIDLDKQFLGKERNSDEDNEYMWLSSTISSPSSIFEDNRFSTALQISIDEWLIAGLSKLLANSYTSYPEDEVLSLVPRRKNKTEENIFREKSLSKSLENESSSSSMTNADSVRYSSYSSSSQISDSISQISDSDRMSFLGSLVDLDGEYSKWISDTELEVDNFKSGFPSPCCKSFEVSLSSSDVKQAADLADFDRDDEPLFWPSEWELDWNSEKSWKSFSMSPRKYTTELRTPQKTSPPPKSIGSKFHVMKMESKKGRRRLMFNSGSTTESKLLELKQRSNNNCIKKNSVALSRLRNSTKNSMKIVPLEMGVEKEVEDLKEAAEDISIPQSYFMDRDFLEGDITLASNGELPIETLVGLGEFDGHEGVDSEFNEDVFSLDDSL